MSNDCREIGPVHIDCGDDTPQRFLRVRSHRSVGWLARMLAAGAGHTFHARDGVRFYEMRHAGRAETIPLFLTLAEAGIVDGARLEISFEVLPPRLMERIRDSNWLMTDLMRSGLPPGSVPLGMKDAAALVKLAQDRLCNREGCLANFLALCCVRWPDDAALQELLGQLSWFGDHVAHVAPTAWCCLVQDERQRLGALWADCSMRCN